MYQIWVVVQGEDRRTDEQIESREGYQGLKTIVN